MELLAILAATLASGVGSVWLAAFLLRLGVGSQRGPGPQHLLSLAAGALLSTAFMHLLPEAFESGIEPQWLFAVLLAGVVFFFLLDKAELWHHGHEHAAPAAGDSHGHDHHDHQDHHAHGDQASHAHVHSHMRASGGWSLVTGDSVHCFGDGVLIASAFMADLRLGLVAAIAVLAHEVPHHIGDLVVMRHSAGGRRMALLKVSLAGAVTALGGLAGYFLLEQLSELLPYFLVAAASSFVYVALADLIPQLQRHLSSRQTFAQIAWLLAGIVLVVAVSRLAHEHGPEDGHDHGHGHEHGLTAPANQPVG
ncbi:ZIP family metal transporter [Xylophilus sp. GOD-11R]|uniref:ZIP family metal transporter n=1 Tax=Xylophilus sp. GOD-11R TaxID=3089814 RepID=UPI00298CEF41|nr:ZIP family metal transporter [Xylophilus sp. GOD-11R]WPB58119.1 ZIP family metal transporter [Xylophilus sp. GOD-11R]